MTEISTQIPTLLPGEEDPQTELMGITADPVSSNAVEEEIVIDIPDDEPK